MKNNIGFIKFVIWLGLILDGISALLYLFPKWFLHSLGLPVSLINPAVTYLLFHAGIFMLGWTILLYWTLQSPIERRFILLLTVLIIIGIGASSVYLLTVPGVILTGLLPLLIIPIIIGALFMTAYSISSTSEYDEN